jgi:hypothetical protein
MPFRERLSKKPEDVKERAKIEAFIARELYGLSLEDWKHLTGTFMFGGQSASKAELDEIISLENVILPAADLSEDDQVALPANDRLERARPLFADSDSSASVSGSSGPLRNG